MIPLRLIAGAALALGLALPAGCRSSEDEETVVLWHHYRDDERAALERVVDDFNARSDDTKIKAVPVAYDAFADKITNAVPNGNGPDLFVFAHDRIGDWCASGLIEPVEYYVDEELAAHYAYEPLAAMAYEGSLYGLPLAVKSVALFYRKDLVEAPPETTDELFEYQRDETYAIVYPNTDLYGHAAWMHGFGARIFDGEGELAVATPQAVRALEFARRLVTEGAAPDETDAATVTTLFNEGKAAMAISGPWFIGDISDGVPWGVTTLPRIGETGEHAAPFLGAEGILMSTRARDKDRAFEVMRALASDASAIRRAREATQVVPNLAAYDEPEIGGDPVLSAFRDQLEHTVPMPAIPAMRMVWTPYKGALQAVIARGANPAASLRGAEDEIDGYIRGAAGR